MVDLGSTWSWVVGARRKGGFEEEGMSWTVMAQRQEQVELD